MLAIVAQRPLLALLLAAGSPAVLDVRSFGYITAVEDLNDRRMHRPIFIRAAVETVTTLEYLLAVASIANLGELAYRLGSQVILTIAPNAEYLAALWIFSAVAIHLLGAIALHLHIKVISKMPEDDGYPQILNRLPDQYEHLTPQQTVRVTFLPKPWRFSVVSWATSVLTACHVVLGTLLFSSMLFISVADGVIMIVRLMASVIACRLMIAYQFAVLPKPIELEY